jgi:hypothetical protein
MVNREKQRNDRCTLWSALTCQRFGRLRPVAVVTWNNRLFSAVGYSIVQDGGDRSPKTKAVTGHRTPN